MFYRLALALTLAISPVAWGAQSSSALAQTQAQNTSLRVVILPFKNLSQNPDDQWLEESFAESLTGALSELDELEVIERNQIQQVLKEHSFGQTELVQEQSAPQLGKLLGAKKMVLGSYQKVNQHILIQARLVDVETGRVEKGYAVKVQGHFDKIFSLQEQLSFKLVQVLDVPHSDAEWAKLSKSLNQTQSTAAYQAYQKALVAGRQQLRLKEAIVYLEQAIQYDPKYALAHAELSQALSNRYTYRSIFTEATEADMPRAIEHAKIAIQLAPNASATYRALASAYWAQGNKGKALEHIRKALEIAPHDVQAILDYISYRFPQNQRVYSQVIEDLKAQGIDVAAPLVRFQLVQSYTKELKSKHKAGTLTPEEIAHGESLLRPLLKDMPASPFVPLKMAELYAMQNDYQTAQKWVDRGLALGQDQFFVFFLAGAALIDAPDPEIARHYLQRSLSLNPKLSFAALLLGISYLKSDQDDKAMAYFKQATESNPQSTLAPFLWGQMLAQKGKYQEAEALLQTSLKNVGGEPSEQHDKTDIYAGFGALYANQKQWRKSEEWFLKSLAVPSPKEQHVRQLAWVYLKQKKYTKALAFLKQHMEMSAELAASDKIKSDYRLVYLLDAQAKDQNNVELLNALGSLLLERQNPEQAQLYLQEAQKLAPKNPTLVYNLGLSYMHQKQWAQAQSLFEQVLTLEPAHANAAYNLGYVFLQRGDKARAERIWQDLLKKHPHHEAAKRALNL